MRDILLASGPIYFLILTIIVIIILLGFLFKRATRKKYSDVKVNIYDPEKEAAEKARKAQLVEDAKNAELTELERVKAPEEAAEVEIDAAESGEEK